MLYRLKTNSNAVNFHTFLTTELNGTNNRTYLYNRFLRNIIYLLMFLTRSIKASYTLQSLD